MKVKVGVRTSPGPAGVLVLAVLACLAVVAATGLPDLLAQAPPARPAEVPGQFVDITESLGVRFHHRIWLHEQGPGEFKKNHYDHGSGVLVADVNGDGRMDLYFLNQDGPNALLVARPDGTFADRTASAGVAVGDRSSSGGAFGDYDNDGDADLYVTTIRQGNLLFRNLGDGRYEDVTAAAGVGVTAHSTTATWVDLDADGYLDLYVGNQAVWTTDQYDADLGYWVGHPSTMHTAEVDPDRFFHNRGDGSFVDWTEKVGLLNDPARIMEGLPPAAGMDHPGGPQAKPPEGAPAHGQHPPAHGQPPQHAGPPGHGGAMAMHRPKFWTADVALADYDGDGWTDLYVTNMIGSDILYRNKGDGTLEDVTRRVLSRLCFGSFGACWTDVDNNGRLDLYVLDMHSDMWTPYDQRVDEVAFGARYNSLKGPKLEHEDPLAERPGHPYLYGNCLYLNFGGYVEEASQSLGLENFWPWGAVAGDLDLDGWQDFFVPAGMGYPWAYSPNFLYLNRYGQSFQDVAETVGLEPRTGGREVAGYPFHFARSTRAGTGLDLDGDGDLDLVTNNWNDRATVWRNDLPAKGARWVGFRLQGSRANRDAVGATVYVEFAGKTQVQVVRSASGYLSQSDPRLVFGLGVAAGVDRVEVVWPGGQRQEVQDFELGRYNLVVQE